MTFGSFTLASGAQSSVYIDVRQTALCSDGASLIGHAIFEEIRNLEGVKGVGGLTLGADPLVTATTMAAHLAERELGGILVRKATKSHGTESRLEVPRHAIQPGDRVVALDDVTTTGGSTLEAIHAMRDWGLVVERAISVVDREENAKALLGEHGVDLTPLFVLSEFRGDSA